MVSVAMPRIPLIAFYSETPHFTLKSINTTSVVLELDNDETAYTTFQVIIQKIVHESNSSRKTQFPANLSGVKNLEDVPAIYITAQLTGNKVVIGDGKNYGGFNNIPLNEGTDYRVYIRAVRTDSKGNNVYSKPRDGKFRTRQIEAQSPTRKPKEAGKSPNSNWQSKLWLIVGVSVAVIVLAVVIITITTVCLTRVREKAKEKREKAMANEEKNMYMSIDDTNIELKKLDGSLKKNKENDKRKERTYATLGETMKTPSSKVEKAYASLDEATRVSSEPSEPKAPTGVYQSLDNLQQSTAGQYESLDEIKNKAVALSSVLKSI